MSTEKAQSRQHSEQKEDNRLSIVVCVFVCVSDYLITSMHYVFLIMPSNLFSSSVAQRHMADYHLETGNLIPLFLPCPPSLSLSLLSLCPLVAAQLGKFPLLAPSAQFCLLMFSIIFSLCLSPLVFPFCVSLPPISCTCSHSGSPPPFMLSQCCTCPLGGSGRHSEGDQWAASPR